MNDLLQPKTLELIAQDGKSYAFILSKIPAVQCREIITQYPMTAMPKIGDYKANETLMLKMMNYVGVDLNGAVMRLSTEALVNNHVPDFEVLMRLEAAMIDYNCSFFTRGTGSTFFALIEEKAMQWISKTLTALSEQSLQKDAPPSMN